MQLTGCLTNKSLKTAYRLQNGRASPWGASVHFRPYSNSYGFKMVKDTVGCHT